MSARRDLDSAVRDVFHAPDSEAWVEAILGPSADEWVISRPLAHLLARLIRRFERRAVLEFGAGLSSVVLATALARTGGRLTSIEHQPEFSRGQWAAVEALPGVDACLVVSRLRLRLSRHGLMYGYSDARGAIARRAPYDLVMIDAPPGKYGRDGTLYDVYPHLSKDALVVVDDAARWPERTAIRRWLDTYPGLRLCLLDETHGRGTAVLIHDGDKRRKLAARAVVGTVHDRLTAASRS